MANIALQSPLAAKYREFVADGRRFAVYRWWDRVDACWLASIALFVGADDATEQRVLLFSGSGPFEGLREHEHEAVDAWLQRRLGIFIEDIDRNGGCYTNIDGDETGYFMAYGRGYDDAG